jgi:hypothetical protein
MNQSLGARTSESLKAKRQNARCRLPIAGSLKFPIFGLAVTLGRRQSITALRQAQKVETPPKENINWRFGAASRRNEVRRSSCGCRVAWFCLAQVGGDRAGEFSPAGDFGDLEAGFLCVGGSAVRGEVDVMGAHPSGYVSYGRDGRMMVMIVGGERKKPAGAVATPEEAQALITSMLAYAGTYTIDAQAKTVVHHIDISWDQARTGTDQVRSYRLDGKRITLTTEPSTDPATGKKTVRTLVWERLE